MKRNTTSYRPASGTRASFVGLLVVSLGSNGCYTYYLRGNDTTTVTRRLSTDPEIANAGDFTSFGANSRQHPYMRGLPQDEKLHLLECDGQPLFASTLTSHQPTAAAPSPTVRPTQISQVAGSPQLSIDAYVRQALPALRTQGSVLMVGCRVHRKSFIVTPISSVTPGWGPRVGSGPAPSTTRVAPPTDIAFTATLVAPAREVELHRAPSRLNAFWMIVGVLTLAVAPVVAFVPGSSDGTNPKGHLGAGAIVGGVGTTMFLGGLYGLRASKHPAKVE
jgi:hypothetical protein